MSKFSQLLSMMNLLKNNGRMKRKEIAAELGISERMVRKYASDLLEANVNLKSFSGRKGGYELHYINLSDEGREAYENTIEELKNENTILKNKLNSIEEFLKNNF